MGSANYNGIWKHGIVSDKEPFVLKVLSACDGTTFIINLLYVPPTIDLFEENKTYQGINVPPPPVLHDSEETCDLILWTASS